MITEKGTVKTTAEINAEVHKELNKTTFILGVILTVCGAILLLCSAVLIATEEEGLDDNLLLCFLGAVFLILGIIYIILRNKAGKNAEKYKTLEENEFFQTYLISREYVNGEHLSTLKVYYDRLVTTRETKNYLFLYNTRVTALTVDKRKLSPAELDAVRRLIGGYLRGIAAQNVQTDQPAAGAQPEGGAAETQGTAEAEEVGKETDTAQADAGEEAAGSKEEPAEKQSGGEGSESL